MEPTQNQTSPAIPIAIIFGFAMIALAIFFTSDNSSNVVIDQQVEAPAENLILDDSPRTVDETDYIFGNPNAPIQIIEYSDYECPFCKRFHNTMGQVMDEYGVTGKVSWVYRQYPISQLHPNAPRISEAALCVGDIGGNTAFWKFSDKIFDEREENSFTNTTRLPEYAVEAGVPEEEYIECVSSGRMQEEVLAGVEEGFRIGALGTPYTIITVGEQQAVINGAQPYNVVKGIVQNLIDQMDGTYESTVSNNSQNSSN